MEKVRGEVGGGLEAKIQSEGALSRREFRRSRGTLGDVGDARRQFVPLTLSLSLTLSHSLRTPLLRVLCL